jgi:hypothetical protein
VVARAAVLDHHADERRTRSSSTSATSWSGGRRHPPTGNVAVHIRPMTDVEILAAELVENSERCSISPVEEAEGIGRLMDVGALSVKATAARLGRLPSWVRDRAALLALTPPPWTACTTAPSP